jgi:hypothetical protein
VAGFPKGGMARLRKAIPKLRLRMPPADCKSKTENRKSKNIFDWRLPIADLKCKIANRKFRIGFS